MNAVGPLLRPLHRIAAALAIAVIMLASASPAAAHGGGDDGAGPANYRSEITDPGSDGLSWRVLDGDGAIELTNTTGGDVVVVGYRGEPYLRFTPDDGVHRNTNSPATYLNEDRYGDADIPPGASPTAEPNWEQVATGASFAWHDHRAHWMSRTPPPRVASDPDREHLISGFEIPLQIRDGSTVRDVSAGGELRWLPDVAWWPPIAVLVVVFVGIVAAVAVATRPSYEQWTQLSRAVTGIISVVIVANTVRTIDDVDALRTGSERAVLAITSLVMVAAIGGMCARGWGGRPGGFAALAGAAMLTMLVFGGEASGDLSAPQLVTSFPEWLRRWTIAASYTVVAPAFLAAVIAGRWYSRTRPNTAPATPATIGSATTTGTSTS